MQIDKARIYEVIDTLRLPMIIGIVYCHTHFFKYLPEEALGQLPLTDGVIYVCYWLIGKIFTPTFFFISGYLFFRQHTMDRSTYAGKIRRRVHTLLIPYLIWNALMLGVMCVQERWMGATSERMGSLAEYGLTDWLYAFYDCTHTWAWTGDVGQPANIPLWFLRDLMIMVIASPLFYYLAKAKRWVAPCVLLAIYCCPFHLPHLQNLSIFWFGMGAWTQLQDINFVSVSRRIAGWCLPVFIVSAAAHELVVRQAWQLPFDMIVPMMRISEFPILIAITSFVLNRTTRRIPLWLSKSSFFIYLSHIVPTSICCMLACRILPNTDCFLTPAYILIPWLVTAVLIAVYLLLNRWTPRTMRILTGNR